MDIYVEGKVRVIPCGCNILCLFGMNTGCYFKEICIYYKMRK